MTGELALTNLNIYTHLRLYWYAYKKEGHMMNTECCTEKHEHNLQTDEAEIETIKAELEIATEKIVYFENLIVGADSMRKLAEDKIIQTQSKKLDSL